MRACVPACVPACERVVVIMVPTPTPTPSVLAVLGDGGAAVNTIGSIVCIVVYTSCFARVHPVSKQRPISITMANVVMQDCPEEVDEGLYSRQLYVMGHAAQRRMASSNVLIVGVKGLGAEIAKNIILAGVKAVTLYDPNPVGVADLSSHFYFTEEDVGKPRGASCVAQLAELNQYVNVSNHTGAISDEFLSTFKCVVMTNSQLDERLRVNDFCHANGIAFIQADVRGLFANVFSDFGDNFTVYDKNGENPATAMVTSIEHGVDEALVTVSDDARHGLEDGDCVTFTEIVGMPELNGCAPRPVTVKSPYTFTIGSTKGFGAYEKGGWVNQVKIPEQHSFKSLRESLTDPGEFLLSDFGKFDAPPVLHLGFQALDKFGGALPQPGSVSDAERLVVFAQEINNGMAEAARVDLSDSSKLDTLRKLAMGAQGDLSPMCAAVGGIVGQEVMKACSGKFMPIKQWFFLDAVECLPDAWPLPPAEYAFEGTRYDGQIAVFGRSFVTKLRQLSYFLVGSGAIGCEMLKNWALMGVATSHGAAVHVTDMDTIEKSNLNRQFLFRPRDVGSAKSTCAAKAATAMNPGMNVRSYEDKVAPETEGTFGDEFFGSLDGVCTALDNVDARLYVDQRCVYYRKPMLESGTLGTKGNTQLVLPYLTENYGASRDPPEKSIPICTLKNFPYQIEHTIQWARDFFEGTFSQAADDVNSYLENAGFLTSLDSQQNTKLETLQRLQKCLVTDRPTTFEECIVWARLQFEELFANNPKQLLHNFPPTMTTSSGQPFWSGHKRQPTPMDFRVDDAAHVAFIVAAANLRAFNYGINGTRNVEEFKKIVATVSVPEFRPREGVKIAADEKEAKEMGGAAETSAAAGGMVDTDKLAADIIAALPAPESLAGYRMNRAEFEKDDDSNFHIDFITACSNLRASNYGIENADKFKTKLIAGKIIPALATTTATVTGLVCLELYKIVQGKKLEAFKNAFVNLAVPLFAFSEPVAVTTTEVETKNGEWKWSIWDRVDVEGPNMTLGDFIAHLEDEYQCEVNMLSCGVTIVYSFFFPPAKRKERGEMALEDVVSKFVLQRDLDHRDEFINFEVCAVDEDDDDVELPYVRYHSRARKK